MSFSTSVERRSASPRRGFRLIPADRGAFQPVLPARVPAFPVEKQRQFWFGYGMAEAFLGLGGNLGDVRQNLDRALALLCADGRAKLRAQSSDFRTPPWGVPDQPSYVNRCAILETDLGPRALLERALAVERSLGRDRSGERRWGPRPIDIDLLSYDDLALDEPGLTLPHPRWSERAFVVVPLAEIAPERVIGGIAVADALARIDASGIERLPRKTGP